MIIDDVFYNTSENRYCVWYHYEGDMDGQGNPKMNWVNVYDLFDWATPVKQTPQSEEELSDLEKTRLANIERNNKFLASLDTETAKPRKKRQKTKK